MQDLFEHVRPKMKRHTSFEEAFEAVVAIEAEDAAAAAAGVQSDDSDSDDGGSRPGLGSDDERDVPLLLKLLVLRAGWRYLESSSMHGLHGSQLSCLCSRM